MRFDIRRMKVRLLRKMDGEGYERIPLPIRQPKKPYSGPLRYHPWVAPACGMLTLLGLVLWSLMEG